MAGKPKNFQAISNVLASYNFTDIAAGIGLINFYAGNTVDKYMLSNYAFYSDTTSINDTTTAAAMTQVRDLDFDVILQRPLEVKGLCIVNVPTGYDSGNNGGSMKIVTTLRRVTGGVESDLATNDETVSTLVNSASIVYKMMSIDLDIPQTHFKIGDTLRMTVEVWAQSPTGTNYVSYLAFDPANRTWDGTGAVPSKLSFALPVRLNL